MEVMNGVHQIPVNYKGRPLKLYLLAGQGGELTMLMDTGDAAVPESDILPYFTSIAFDPKKLTHVMATHPDVDHTGGLHRMYEAAPQAKFVCGTADREQIESPEGLIQIRMRAHYHWHQMGMDDAAVAKFMPRAGGYVPIAETFSGGETLRWDAKKYVEVLHLPGHSHGHLGVYLPWENAAIIGDAVHGTANRFLDGKASFACTYMYIDSYLGTIDRLQSMKLSKLFSCHWPDCLTNEEVNSFLNQSAQLLRPECGASDPGRRESGRGAGATLKDVCTQAKPGLGDWPADRDGDTQLDGVRPSASAGGAGAGPGDRHAACAVHL